MKSAERERTAYHEAGHAVLAHYLCTGFKSVTIAADHDSAGHVLSVNESDPDVENLHLTAADAFWQRKAIGLYAGAEAVRHKWPKSHWKLGAGNDYHWAGIALEKITNDAQVLRALHAYASRTARLAVVRHWSEIEHVALALLKARTLNADAVRAAIHASISRRIGSEMSVKLRKGAKRTA